MTTYRKQYDDDDQGGEIMMPPLGGDMLRQAGLILGVVILAGLLYASIAYVPPGHVGVLTMLGKVTDDVLPEGTHFVNPIKVNHKMSIRTVELKETAEVPSNEGLLIKLDTSLLFRLDPLKANDVFRTIGPRYVDVVVEPNLRSAIRGVTASHTANALYTGGREEVAQRIRDELTRELGPLGISVQAVLLRDVQLPAIVRTAIEAKQQAEQEALRMSFVLDREQREAERKRIEAAGIRDFQQIVAQGISQQLLTWKGIEATEKLASSNNSKVVVIGSGRTGLPIILNTGD